MMFGFFPDGVVEENVREGLANELIYFEHREILDACRRRAKEISDKLTPKERRFICEMKARSIILPFSQESNNQKHMSKGDMATLVDLVQVVEVMREQKLGHCLNCVSLHVEIERGEDGKLIVHASSNDKTQCNQCRHLSGNSGKQKQLQKPL